MPGATCSAGSRSRSQPLLHAAGGSLGAFALRRGLGQVDANGLGVQFVGPLADAPRDLEQGARLVIKPSAPATGGGGELSGWTAPHVGTQTREDGIDQRSQLPSLTGDAHGQLVKGGRLGA